jgi:hypothetical protein
MKSKGAHGVTGLAGYSLRACSAEVKGASAGLRFQRFNISAFQLFLDLSRRLVVQTMTPDSAANALFTAYNHAMIAQ